MRNFYKTLMVFGAFELGVGLERGFLPGVGLPFWIILSIGAVALIYGAIGSAASS